MQSCKGKSYMSILSIFFSAIFAGPRFAEVQKFCFHYHHDITTSPLYSDRSFFRPNATSFQGSSRRLRQMTPLSHACILHCARAASIERISSIFFLFLPVYTSVCNIFSDRSNYDRGRPFSSTLQLWASGTRRSRVTG